MTASSLSVGDTLVLDDSTTAEITALLTTELGNVFVWIPGCLPHEPLVFDGLTPVTATTIREALNDA